MLQTIDQNTTVWKRSDADTQLTVLIFIVGYDCSFLFTAAMYWKAINTVVNIALIAVIFKMVFLIIGRFMVNDFTDKESLEKI